MSKMKNPLNKRLPREIRSNLGRYISMFLLLTTTILIGSSFLAVLESVQSNLEEHKVQGVVEDGQIETVMTIDEETLELLEDEGITVTENFYATDNEYEGETKVLVFGARDTMNIPAVFEGQMPQSEDEIAIDRIFAFNHELAVGDVIMLNEREFTVCATIAMPDYTSLFKSNKDMVMDTETFGVACTTQEGLDRFPEDEITYRYSYRYLDRDLTTKEKADEAKELQQILIDRQIPVQSFLTAANNQGIAFLEEDLGTDAPMIRIFVYILVCIIAFVFAVLTNNTIEEEAQIIGTLRASGYKKGEVILHYLTPTILIAVLGSVAGNAIGYTLMIKPFEDMYYLMYCIPPIRMQFSIEGFLTTTVLPVVIMVVINVWMLAGKLSLSPLRFLRGDLQSRKQKKAIRLPNFSFMNRFRLRVIIQNKGSYFVLFLGIFLSSFLLMFGVGMGPLIDHYVQSIDDTLPYEYQYVLKAPVEAEGGEAMRVYTMSTWYELGKLDIDISFMGIDADSEIFNDIELPSKENEIVISKPVALKLGLGVGDEVTFYDEYKEKEYILKVANVSDFSASMCVFMDREVLNRMLGDDEELFNSYVSNKKLDIDDAYIAKYITRADLLGATRQMMVAFKSVIAFLDIFSVAIFLILMYLLAKSVIERNAIHISFMKVFGYNAKEVNKLYLNATTITVVLSLLVCLPLEVWCMKGALVLVAILMEGYLEFYLPLRVYAEIVAIGLASYFVINSFLVLKVRKIPMSLALKSRE